jgi:signal transduction histidine kinase
MRLRPPRTVHGFSHRLPRRPIRMRLALLYFWVFVASGAVLLAFTVALWQARTTVESVVVDSAAHRPIARYLPPNPVNPTRTGGSPGPTTIRVQPVKQHNIDLEQLLIVSGIALAMMGGASIGLGWVIAGRFLKPLRTITTATRAISATNLHQRLNLAGPDDELKELGDTFDDLLARLERSFQFERRFVANASHELRTPLATMRASLDVAMAKPGPVPPQIVTLAGRLWAELDRVDRLLESFLTLAHAQQGPIDSESNLSLDDIASAAVKRRAGAIAHLELTVDQQTCSPTRIRGSETLLSRMVENVIDNAVNHNQPGGWVRITTAVEGPVVRLVVENGGPVFAQDDVDELAQPFRRLGTARTGSDKGTGLGLSIVKSIVEANGGTLDLHALSTGGLRVGIALPRAVGIQAGVWA